MTLSASSRSISLLRQLRLSSVPSLRLTMPLRAKISHPNFPQRNMSSTAEKSAQPEENDVLFSQQRGNKTITLNRPKKLNSLNLSMIEKILPRLKTWEKSDLARAIFLKGKGDKAFCAGGDVAALVTNSAVAKERERFGQNYFRHEYTLDYYIATFPKPIIAIMDGITMGGGVGLSINTPFRIATEKTIFAMPETLIGFFPDVGATYFLPRLDGQLGIYLGLTGHQLKAYDTVWAGIATHYIPSERMLAVESRIAEIETHDFKSVNEVLNEFESGPPQGYNFSITPEIQTAIDRIFAFNDMVSIIRNLESEVKSNSPIADWAHQTLETLNLRSPTSLHVSLKAMRDTAGKSRYHTFQREYELASKFMLQRDFAEGVTARLLERRPATWLLPTSALKLSATEAKELIWERGRFDETLEDSFFLLEAGKRETAPDERGLFKFSLPMEATVLATLMRGKMDGSKGEEGKFRRKELVEYMVGESLGRAGFERKLNSILDRRTVEDEVGRLIWKFDDGHIG